MLLEISVLSPKETVFQGVAKSIILPGEQGAFEVLPFHKRILSRLIAGNLFIDGEKFPLRRGVVKVDQNRVTVIIEQNET